MGQLASERLAISLARESAGESPAFQWPTWHMGKPTVDLQDRDALWRALDADAQP